MKKLIELDPKPKTVAELYAIPGTWTRGAMYRGDRSQTCEKRHAVACCLGGAAGLIYGPAEVGGKYDETKLTEALDKMLAVIKSRPGVDAQLVPTWNDHFCANQEEARRLAEEAGV